MVLDLFQTDPLWYRNAVVPKGEVLERVYSKFVSKQVGVDMPAPGLPEFTLGGMKFLPQGKMPTKVEDAGIKFAAKYEAGGLPMAAASGIWDINSNMAVAAGVGPDMPPIGVDAVVSSAAKVDIVLTERLLASLPDMKFKNQFQRLAPTAKLQSLVVCWGYGLHTLPSSIKGAGFSDKYQFRLWLSDARKGMTYPVAKTGIGYDNRITQQARARSTGNQRGRVRVDEREFQSRFDQIKNLPTEFYRGGLAKSEEGDNHVAFLTMALLRLYGLKMAAEQGARGHITMSRKNTDTFIVNVSGLAVGRASVFTGVATALENTWFRQGRTPPKEGDPEEWWASEMYEMLLPSAGADESEIVYLAYLAGHLDDSVSWRSEADVLAMSPIYNTIRSEAPNMMRIPLANASRALDLNRLSSWDKDLELGRAEGILNQYIVTHELGTQVEVAKHFVASVLLSARSNSGSSCVLALPWPNHVSEYDLWTADAPAANTSFDLVTQHESASLLAVMCQLQMTMRADVLVADFVATIEDQNVLVTSADALDSANEWARKTAPHGITTWLEGWHTTILGSYPPEIRRVANPNMASVVEDTLMQIASGVMRVSSLLYFGVKATAGALALVWNESERNKLLDRRFITNPQAQILNFLFRGEPLITEAHGANWADIVSNYEKRRNARRVDTALGVRTKNTIIGEPKIIYIGLTPEPKDMDTRMLEAQSMSGVFRHYEPAFDINTASYFTAQDAVLPAVVGGPLHSKEPKHTKERTMPPYTT